MLESRQVGEPARKDIAPMAFGAAPPRGPGWHRLFPVSNFRNLCKQFLMDTNWFALAPQGR